MATFVVQVESNTRDSEDVAADTRPREFALNLMNYFKSLASGARPYATTVITRNTGVKAVGKVTLSSATGTVTITINGVNVSVSAGADDTETAVLLAAAINASTNALVQHLVTATSALGVVTITASVAGKVGNCITLAATAGGGTATATGARLGTGTGSTAGSETRTSLSY
jgi:phage tail sheath gpL-like